MVNIHPLVILNIADHYTRFRAQSGSVTENLKARGICIGQGKDGTELELVNSFEMPIFGENTVPNTSYIIKKHDQYKQVFKAQEIIAWYCVDTDILPEHVKCHQCLLQALDSQLLFILFKPQILQNNNQIANENDAGQKLPIIVFEFDAEEQRFSKKDFHLVTDEAEHVGLATVTEPGAFNGALASTLEPFLVSQVKSLKMLQKRLLLIKEYIDSVGTPKAPLDRALLRKIQCLISSLPVLSNSEMFKETLQTERDSALLIKRLAGIFEGLAILEDATLKRSTLRQLEQRSKLSQRPNYRYSGSSEL